MTPRAYVGKSQKTLAISQFQRDKNWLKLFDTASNYQTVLVTIFPRDAEYPIAGVGLQVGLEQYPETVARTLRAAGCGHLGQDAGPAVR
jgi:hypothetical protein